MKQIEFAESVLGAWAKGYPLSMLLHGTPLTIRFRKDLAMGLPASCRAEAERRDWLNKDRAEGHAFVFCMDGEHADHEIVTVNADAEVIAGPSRVDTEATTLVVDTTAVSLLAFGEFKPRGG